MSDIAGKGGQVDASDWNPRSPEVLDDQIAAYDALRRRCPVGRSDYLHWSLLRHEGVMRALLDHETFSNAAFTHLTVPNGMDPPQHTAFRRIIEPYFAPEMMAAFEPACRDIAETVAARLPERGEMDVIPAVAEDFALRVQCAFMGWPDALHEPLRAWARRSAEATLARDPTQLAAVALEFDGHIRALLQERREAGQRAPRDVTSRLMQERADGRPLTDPEIVSIIRNWTVGEVGTIAASVGIVLHYLAERPALQDGLRATPADLPAAIDEILRIHAPLIANRRVTTRPVVVGVRPSTGSVGDAYDNALAEAFFATLECELLDRRRFRSQAEARMAVFHFIEGFYNPTRRHSSLGYLSPIEFEARKMLMKD